MKWDEVEAMKAFISAWEKEHKFLATVAEFVDGVVAGPAETIVFIVKGDHGEQYISPELDLGLFCPALIRTLNELLKKRGEALAAAKPSPIGE